MLTFNNPGTGISAEGARSLLRGLDEFRDRTAGESAVDYGLCAVVTGQQDDPAGELPALIDAGVPTFKAFMVYDFALPDDALERVMRTAARNGGMLQLHCEEPGIIDPLVGDALARGDVSLPPSRAHAAGTRGGRRHAAGDRDGTASRRSALHRPPQLRGGARRGRRGQGIAASRSTRRPAPTT